MFVLVVPRYTERGYSRAAGFVSSALAAAPEWTFFCALPFGSSPIPGGVTVPCPDPGPSDPGLPTHYDSGWFDSFSRQFAVDYIWTGDAWAAQHVRYSGDCGYGTGARPTVLLDGGAGVPCSAWEAVQEAAALVLADLAVFSSGPALLAALGRAGAILNPRVLALASSRVSVAADAEGGLVLGRLRQADDYKLDTAEDAAAYARGVVAAHADRPFPEFYAALKGKFVNGRVPYSNQSMPMTKALRLVRLLGGSVYWGGGAQRVSPRPGREVG